MSEVERLIKSAMKKKKRVPRFPRLATPDAIERSYRRELIEIISTIADEINRQLIGRLEGLAQDYYRGRPDLARQDAAGDDLNVILDRVRVKVAEKYSDEQIARIAERKGIEVAAFNEEVLAKGFKRVAAVDIWFNQPWLKPEMELFSAANTVLITSMRDEAINRTGQTVMQGFRAGHRWEEIRKKIQADIDPRVGNIRARANLIARDQVSKLNGQLTYLRQAELGIDKYRWRTSLDERVRASHRALEGQIFKWSDPPSVGHPGEDYQCVVSGTKIDFPTSPVRAFKRLYAGTVMKITTVTGISISITPNHPILTTRGWVRADQLKSTDQLLECLDPKVSRVLDDQIDDRAVSCDDIYNFLQVVSAAERVRGSDVQFHGDGVVDEEVEVIGVPDSLGNDFESPLHQKIKNLLFPNADLSEGTETGQSDFASVIIAVLSTPSCSVGARDLSLSLIAGHVAPFEGFRLGLRPDLYARLKESCPYDVATGGKFLRDRILAEPFTVQGSDLIYVELQSVEGSLALLKAVGIESVLQEDYSGPVFNYSTTSGMYLADGLAVSNCRCVAEPYLDDILPGATSDDGE